MYPKLSKDDLISWIEKVLEDEKFKIDQIKVTGTTENGDGYLGDIVFAKVCGTIKENEEKMLNLVIKHGKNNDHLRETTPVRPAFEVEIYVYNKIFPTFRNLEVEKGIKDGFSSVPKCFGTFLMDNMEVVILENLKELGYELYDRKYPLNINHQKVVLREYGKYHALSFAMRDQHTEEFEKLVLNLPEDTILRFVDDSGMTAIIDKAINQANDIFSDENEFFEKFKREVGRSSCQKLRELLLEKEPQSVILHGDCWNNNFMYKYENTNKKTPSKLAILDWQMTSLRSPVFDLSYFIYATSSKEELDQFNELLIEYYASFSSFLRQLGSDPDKLFPFSDLKEHWRKYSFYGLILLPMILTITLCEKEDTPRLENMKDGEQMTDMFKFEITEKDAYRERFIAGLNNHFNY